LRDTGKGDTVIAGDDQLITIKEAAQRLEVSDNVVRNLIKNGKLRTSSRRDASGRIYIYASSVEVLAKRPRNEWTHWDRI
jgi:predicted site-specific integrase-resolvase